MVAGHGNDHLKHGSAGLNGKEGQPRRPGDLVEMYGAHSRVEIFRVLTLTHGISGKPKLLTYRLTKLVMIGGLFTALQKGTILIVDDGVLKEVLKLSAVFTAAAVTVYGLFPDDQLSLMGKDSVTVQSLEDLVKYMNGFVPFVLSLYVSLALSRWWALRTQALGKVFEAVANTTNLIACMLPEARHRKVRDTIVKWSIASIFLVVKAARNNTDEDGEDPEKARARDLKDLSEMQDKGLLSAEEVELLATSTPYGRAMALWGWVMRLSQESLIDASGPPPHAPKLTLVINECIMAREGIQMIHTFLQTQLPFAYVHLITLIVNMNNIVLSMTCGTIFTISFSNHDYQTMAYQVLKFILVPVLYHGLLSISYVIHDPFGDDMLDFPIAAFIKYVAECCDAALFAQETYPLVSELVGSGSYEGSATAGPSAEEIRSAQRGSEVVACTAVKAMKELSAAVEARLDDIGMELELLGTALAANEERRKNDANRLADSVKQGQANMPLMHDASAGHRGKPPEPWCLHAEAAPAHKIFTGDKLP